MGRASAIELRGQAGVGKSSLTEIAISRAARFRTVVIRGEKRTGMPIQRSEWPQPLRELVDQVRLLDADAKDAAHVSAAVAERLAEVVGESQIPVLLSVDDAQHLPIAFVNAIAESVCTQLQDKPVSLIVARSDAPNAAPLPAIPWPTTHTLTGLNAAQTETLLSVRLGQNPTERVIAQLVGGTAGIPLALIDVCARLSAAQLAGWQPLPDPLPVGPAVIDAYDLAAQMPQATRAALVVRAVTRVPGDRLGELLSSLGLDEQDLAPAIEAGIVMPNGTRMEFCHPLVRAAIFHGSSSEQKQLARAALNAELERPTPYESRAYFAVTDPDTPDEIVAGRFAETARVAMEQGDPEAAAQSEEQAARFAPSDDAVVSHLAAAAALWRAAGVEDRARYCIDTASQLSVVGAAAGQLAYQRAWLLQDQGELAVGDHILQAAELSLRDAPHDAATMLVDAAAWKLLGNDQAGAEQTAERAVAVAASVSSYAENLASLMRVTVVRARGAMTDDSDVRLLVASLVAQADHYPASPEAALVLGQSLQRQGLAAEAARWVEWLERCAERDGNVQLRFVAQLLDMISELARLNVAMASRRLGTLLSEIDVADSAVLVAWTWAVAVHVRVAAGEHEHGFADSVNLLALPPAVGAMPRLLATASLASLDLQRGRIGAAQAWIATAVEELGRSVTTTATGEQYLSAPIAGLAPLASTVALLSAQHLDPSFELSLAPIAGDSWRTWISALYEPNPEAALVSLGTVRERLTRAPFALVHVDLCRAVKLLQAGRRDEARALLEEIRDQASRSEASGIAGLAAEQLHKLESSDAAGAMINSSLAEPRAAREHNGTEAAALSSTAAAAWELTLLGDFSVRCDGELAPLPPGLATEAIKIVALNRQIIVDQLVELLWEDASPGVGVRRLRNVLWRIRTSCGELVLRDGQFLRLANDAVTDVGRFETLAARALDRVTPLGEAAAAAREALQLYRGELLPANRYDDWTTRARELVARTKVSLLELLIDDALDNERTGEALTLLDRLVQEDPNDEAPLVRIAELHLLSGNRSRAMESLDRAEAILRDLGIGTTPAISRLRERLSRR